MITYHGIKANLEKITAIMNMNEPETRWDSQSLNRKFTTLSTLLSISIEKTLIFFKILRDQLKNLDMSYRKRVPNVEWKSEVKRAF